MANFDATHPGDTDIVSQFPANERAARAALITNFGVNHWSTNDANVGKHTIINLLDQGADPSAVAGQGNLYVKSVSARSELFWRDSTGAAIQITSANTIPATLLSGTVADARLSANVPLLNAANTFTATNIIDSGATASPLALKSTAGAYINVYKGAGAIGAIGSAEGLGGTAGALAIYVGGAIRAEFNTSAATSTLHGITISDFARLSQNNTFTGANVFTLNGGSVFKSTVNTAAINNFLSFQDSSAVERAYVGFGIGASSIFSVRNATAGAELRLSSSGGSITLDGVAATDFARLSQSNVFTGVEQRVANNSGLFSIYNTANSVRTGYLLMQSAGDAILNVEIAQALAVRTNNLDRLRISSAGDFDFKGGAVTTNNASASEVGFKGIPQNSQAGGYTCVLADANKHIYQTSAGVTDTIPANGSVAYPVGTTLTFVNAGGGAANSIAITTDTMYLAGTAFGTTGTRTLSRGSIATALKIAATQWLISGTGLS